MARAIANLALGAALAAALVGCGSGARSSDAGGAGGAGGIGGAAGGAGGAAGTTDAGMVACGPAKGVGGATTDGTVGWTDDGIPQCATLVEITSSSDFLGIIAISGDAQYSVEVIVSSPGTALGGTYPCTNSAVSPLTMLEVIDPGVDGAADSCSITVTITDPGLATSRAQGTFSGTVDADGGARAVTNGVFDVALPPSS